MATCSRCVALKFPVCLIFRGRTSKGNASHKLWAIKVIKNKFVVIWGKAMAQNLQTKTKSTKNHSVATEQADKLIMSKLKKGYVLV